MLKNLKRASAIMLSLAMAVQFGMADTYFANTLSEEPIIEETQEQEPVTVEEGSQQVAVEQTEAPAIDAKEEFVQVPETKSVTLSYVAEDGTILRDATTHEYEMGYSLNSDASVMLNFDGYTLKDVVMNDSQIVAAAQANLNVTSDLTSVKFVYQKVMTELHPEANEAQEENKTEEKTEEDAEADPEAKEELPEYPAFDMSATAGNVTVHVTAAEGVLPSGAQLIVKRVTRKAILNAVEETVTEKDKEVDSAIALDITIVNADGIEIQPNGIVNVSFENVAVGGEEVNVYHVTDDASTVTEVATNTQSFDANHFSIYVITGEKKVELTTFNFVANEQNVSTQIVKTGDTLITPTAPDIAGKAFVEWQENGSKFDGFGVQTITKTEARTITAKYEDALYVYFYNPEGTQIMRTEKVADHNSHDYSHVSYDVDSTHKLVGWAAEVNGTDNITKNIAVPEGSTSVNVYAIIKEGYWVTFDSNGGSAIDSQFVFDKISLNDQTTPTKPGYEFAGWYNGTEKVENDATISSPMTLTAHWIPKQVSYTVIHWWENADDDGYSFHESENKTGLTGTEANAKAKSYEGFTAQPVTKKTIRGDGSTIVSVYYKRNVYEVKFYSYSTPGFGWWDPGKPSKEYEDLKITAKYGQDISKKWPTYKGSSTWRTNDGSGAYQVNIGTMPLGGATFYGPKTGDEYETAYYYVEALPGEASDVTVSGIRYKLDHKDTSPGQGYYVTKEDQYPLTGFTFNEKSSTKIKGDYDNAKFYYTRNSYKIKFINKGKEDKSVEKKYEQSISSENYTPTRPSSLPEYYVFDGWYENELCEGEAYNFTGKKMPAQNVTLYAKWTAKKINLTYNLNNPEGTVDKDTKKVEAGTVASTVLPSIPTINEYSFAGWYYADGNGNITSEVFNTNNTITRDTSIVGKWLYKGELRVIYKPGSETGATVPTDGRVYAGGARVTVAKNATTTSGKKFLGWELNGNVYKPGQSFEVNKDIANKDNQIILTATWGNAETSTTLTYNPGNGRGNLQTVNVMNNEAVEIEAHGSLGFSAPVQEGKEYYFAGWADSKTGNATYADGQTINIDANGENVLYAVWVEKAKITVVAKSDEITYDGNNHILDGFNSLTIDGYTVSGLSASVSGTDAGTYNNVITGEATVTKDGKDVTNRVVVTKQNGTLTINKRQVTLTSEGGSKPYDGTALTKPDVAIGGLGFVNGEVKDIKATGSVTNVSDGEVTNTITYTPSEKFNENNYQITKTEGKLSITAVEAEVQVQIVGATDTVGYDGHEHRVEGYTVTINNDKYHEADFTFSGNKVAKGINAGTYNMELAVEQFKNNSSNFSNVTFTVTDGCLVITPKSINTEDQKITVSDPQGHVYDGNPHQEVLVVRDAELDKTLKSGKDYDVYYSTKDFTNVGEITITITGKGNYVGTVNKTYSITKRQVTLTSEGGSKPYDGTPLTRPDVTVGGDGFVTGEVTSVQAIGTVTEVKDSPVTNAIEYTVGTKFNINNYEISMTEGTLSITPKSINPDDQNMSVSDPQGHVYDGLEHKEELEVKDIFRDVILSAGTDYDVAYSTKDFTNVGKIIITITGKGNYTGTFDRTYEITPATLTVTTPSVNKVYDGTPLTAEGTISGFVNKETATFTTTGSQTEVGSSSNTYSIEWDGTAKSSNYKISETVGTLTVTENENEIVVTTKHSSYTYDGLAHGTEVTVSDLPKGYSLEKAASSATATDVTTAIEATCDTLVIKNAEGKDVTNNLKITKVPGSITITPATLTVTMPSANKVYDGTPLTADGTISGFVNNETATFTTTGSQTEVGNSKNTYSIKWNGTAKSTNYQISEAVGTLTVTQQSIDPEDPENNYNGVTINKPSNSVYDGKEHKWSPAVADKEGNALVEGTDYEVAYSTSDFRNVTGTITVTITGVGNYTGKVTRTYEITPKAYTVTTDSANKVYDGTALTAGGKIEGIVDGENVEFKVTGSQTNKGTSKNTYSLKWNGSATETNYKLAKESIGDLTVTEQTIDPGKDPDNPNPNYSGVTINKPSNSVYDGKEHKWSPAVADKEGNALVEGTDYEVAYSTSDFRNVTGTITVTITGVGNYTGKVTRTYEITPKAYTVTTDSANKVYDGTPLTADGTISGFVNNETATFTTTGSQTEVGNSKNTYSIKWNGTAKSTNYQISEAVGTLTVTQQSIDPEDPENNYNGVTINKPSNSVYDGKEHKWSPAVADKEGNALVEGTDYEVAYSTSDFRNVTGTITVTITGVGNYTGKVTRTYEITPKAYTVTTDSANKVYDGTALTAGGKIEGIVDGENVEFKVTGSQTNKGTSKNTYSLKWNGSATETNYKLAKESIGDLTVTEQTIDPGKDPDNPNPNYSGVTINKPSNSVYDGKEHKWSPAVADKEGNALVEGTDYEVAYSTEDFTNVTGTITVTITGIGNYTGTVTRTYEITPKSYTVTTESAKKVYDGTALTAGGKIEGIVDGEVVVVHTTGSQTEVGSTPNTYKLEWKKASSKNYKLKEDSIGTLTVTEQTIDPGKDPNKPNPNYSGVTINNPSNAVYDGKVHKWSPAVTDKEGNALVEGTDYTVEYSTSDFTNVTGTITVTITGIGNYTGTVTRTYEITPKAYTVTTESAKKVYDGTALTAGGKIEGIVSGETVEFTTTGSRTDEGTSKNTYSLKWNGSAVETNYKLEKESIGDLTVTPKSIIPDEPNTPDDKKTGITVSNPKDSKYDGQEHREVLTVKDTKTGKDLIANKDYTVVYSDDLVNAGTVTIKVSGLGNYSGSFTKTYKITKRLVTLTSATVSKTYDGQALTNTSITVSGDGFVEGEGASYEVTGTQTSVGNSANAFEYKLNEKTLASNYDITKVVGTLTITAAPAPVTPPTSPTPVSPPPVTPRYIQQVVPAPTPQEEVKKEKTPKAEPKEEKVEKVEKEKTPKARPEKFWALINLICAIVTVLFGLLLLISKRHKNKDDEDDETKDQTTTNEDEEKEQEKKRGAFTRVLAVLIAILSVVFFLVTEDMSLRWTWTDQWTIWMVVIGLVQIVVFFVGRKWKNVDDDEDEQAQQA